MNIILDIEQGSDEWKALRLGRITASKFADVISNGRGSAPSKTRQSYMTQIAAEILTGQVQDDFSSKHMEWGNQTEPQARSMYEFRNGVDVDQVAFIEHDNRIGVSPDGMIGDSGLLEIKCPKTTTQIERFLAGGFPPCYKAQVQGQLWVSQREWCDFVSYDPRLDCDAGYFQIRVDRDEEFIATLADKVYTFRDELERMIYKLTNTPKVR